MERKYILSDREYQLVRSVYFSTDEVVDYETLRSGMGVTEENLRSILSRVSAKDAELLDVEHGVGIRMNNPNGLSVNWTKKEFTRTIPDNQA